MKDAAAPLGNTILARIWIVLAIGDLLEVELEVELHLIRQCVIVDNCQSRICNAGGL
jgi:hypothetical protein